MELTNAVHAHPRLGDRTVYTIRDDFPILKRKLDEHKSGESKTLIYFDNAATSQKPRNVLQAVTEYYQHSNANVHRALHTLGEEATLFYEESRNKVQKFINAGSSREIIFTRRTTESINLIAASWGRKFLKRDDAILLTEMEHHSNLVPWQMIAGEIGFGIRFIPFGVDGELELEKLEALWDKRIRLVSIVHVSNVFGTINDIKKIIEFSHRRDVPVLIDSAQGVPHLDVDVQELDCDFLAFSGHKMCGPMGIGVLYGKEKWLDEMKPYMGGGEMIRTVRLEKTTWNELPYKFEAGTPNVEGAIGLGAAIDYLSDLGMINIQQYEKEITGYALHRIHEIPGITVYGSPSERGGVLSFNLNGIHAHDAAQFLDTEAIAVRAGHHCAQPLMRKLGIPAAVRASFYFYNTFDEIDKFADALNKTKEFFLHGA
jgi:cysteine desulfurase/selenocysteine lyase